MMIDRSLIFASAPQAVTATAVSTDIVDTLAAGDSFLPGAWLVVSIDTTFTSNGATVQFELQTATDAAFTSPVTLLITPAVAVATLVARYSVMKTPIPIGVLRYLRMNYTVASGPAAAGKVFSAIVLSPDVNLP